MLTIYNCHIATTYPFLNWHIWHVYHLNNCHKFIINYYVNWHIFTLCSVHVNFHMSH